MSHQVPWNKVILQQFIKIGALTELQQNIMRTRVAGMSRKQQSRQFCLSLSSLDKIINRLKTKYDYAQRYSDILPQRKFSCQQTYASLKSKGTVFQQQP